MEQFNQIPSGTLGPADVLVVHVGCGNLPPQRVKEHVALVQANLREVFGDQPMIMAATPERCLTFSIIHRPAWPNVGNMSTEYAKLHLDKVSAAYRKM